MAAQSIPEGHHSVTPYLCIDGAAKALDFYKRAFGATETMRLEIPGGRIGHAEITIGDSSIMLADMFEESGLNSPRALGGSPIGIHLYVDDVDALFAQAIAAGGVEMMAVQDMFYGDRSGTLRDPFGHVWTLSTHMQDVPADEIARRAQKMFEAQAR